MENLKNFIEKNQEKLVKIHWNSIINEYTNNIKLSNALLKELEEEEYFKQSSNLSNFFGSINKNIDNYIKNVINPTYQIAIVGAIKAGKSTLINTLIGHDLASVSVTPETATLTKFRSSKINYLKVTFYTTNDWKEIWKNAQDNKAQAFLKEYENLKAEEIKNTFLNKEELYVEYTSLDDMKNDISKWSSSEAREHYFVKELEIGLSDLNLPSQICLVDTPGLNDVIDYRSKITRDYIDSANAVLVCVNAKTMRNEEMVTITKAFSKARYKKDKIYILGTQIDSMNSLEDWEKVKKHWIKLLDGKEYFESAEKAKSHIIGVSAHAYLKGNELKDNLNDEDIVNLNSLNVLTTNETSKMMKLLLEGHITTKEIEEIKEKTISYSKINEIKDIVENKFLKNYNNSLVEDYKQEYIILKDEIISFKEKHKKIIEDKKKELEMSSQELNNILEKEKEKLENIKKINENLKQKIKETSKEFKFNFSKLAKGFEELEKAIKNINID